MDLDSISHSCPYLDDLIHWIKDLNKIDQIAYNFYINPTEENAEILVRAIEELVMYTDSAIEELETVRSINGDLRAYSSSCDDLIKDLESEIELLKIRLEVL
jgi:hypothetical protein